MARYDSNVIERIARAIREGSEQEVRRLLTAHREYLAFIDFRDRITTADIQSWYHYATVHGREDIASVLEWEDPVRVAIGECLEGGNLPKLQKILKEHPAYIECDRDSMLTSAARTDHVDVVRFLLGTGGDVNRVLDSLTLLERAARNANPDMVAYLLRCGADPNIGRPIISAINRESEESALEILQLLIEYGADVNREFDLYGDKDTTFTALEFVGEGKIADFLRSKGAVDRKQKVAQPPTPTNRADEVVAYLKEHFGEPQARSQIEIVPTEPPIAIHVIPAANDRKTVTLFTTGMCEHPMTPPNGEDDYRYAELCIQLPGDWPVDKRSLAKPKYGWPVHWLRSIAKYPHQHGTWLGGPVTIIANGDPPEPLSPGLKFTSLLVMADRQFTSRDGRKIYLYRLTPLYTEERDLEIKHGIGALVRAFDENDIPSIVDLDRPNVAKEAR